VNEVDKNGYTPLHICASRENQVLAISLFYLVCAMVGILIVHVVTSHTLVNDTRLFY
jgi:hypothetical protein